MWANYGSKLADRSWQRLVVKVLGVISVLLFLVIANRRASAEFQNKWQGPVAAATPATSSADKLSVKSNAEREVNASLDSVAVPVTKLLDLPEPPPQDSYAITGKLLPPFLMAVLSAWRREFPDTPLTENGVIFVIQPKDFYADLNTEQTKWLTSREMLSIQNFPLIINPLTPGDDWYLRAQREWKRGNEDAIFVLLTSIYHEFVHSRQSGNELSAYKAQLELFETFQKRGKLVGPYALTCYKVLRDRYLDVTKHPEKYVQVTVQLGRRAAAIHARPHEPAISPSPD